MQIPLHRMGLCCGQARHHSSAEPLSRAASINWCCAPGCAGLRGDTATAMDPQCPACRPVEPQAVSMLPSMLAPAEGRPSFSTTRSLALRLRGLAACSSGEATSGFLVTSLTSRGAARTGSGPSLSKAGPAPVPWPCHQLAKGAAERSFCKRSSRGRARQGLRLSCCRPCACRGHAVSERGPHPSQEPQRLWPPAAHAWRCGPPGSGR